VEKGVVALGSEVLLVSKVGDLAAKDAMVHMSVR